MNFIEEKKTRGFQIGMFDRGHSEDRVMCIEQFKRGQFNNK